MVVRREEEPVQSETVGVIRCDGRFRDIQREREAETYMLLVSDFRAMVPVLNAAERVCVELAAEIVRGDTEVVRA